MNNLVMTRRNFIKTTAVALSSASLAGCRKSESEAAPEPVFDPAFGELIVPSVPPARIVDPHPQKKSLLGWHGLAEKAKQVVDPNGDHAQRAKEFAREKGEAALRKVGEKTGLEKQVDQYLDITTEQLIKMSRQMLVHFDRTNKILSPDHPLARILP